MKKTSLIPLLLILTACGGSNSPVSTLPGITTPTESQIPSTPTKDSTDIKNDTKNTTETPVSLSIKTSADNKAEIVAYVEGLGIDLTQDIDTEVSGDTNRSASSRKRTASNNSITSISLDTKYNIAQKKYNRAKNLLDKGIGDIRKAGEEVIVELLKFFGLWNSNNISNKEEAVEFVKNDANVSEIEAIDKNAIADKMELKTLALDKIKFNTLNGSYLQFELNDDKISNAIFKSSVIENDAEDGFQVVKYKDFKKDGNKIISSHSNILGEPNREKYYGYSFKYDNGETGFIAELTEESMVYNLIREKFEDKMVANAEECTENCYYVNDEALLTEKPDSDSGSLETYSIPSETLNKAIEEMKNSSLYKNGITFNEYSELVLMGNSLNLSYSEFGYNTFYVKDLKDAKTGEKILEDTVDEVETFFGGYDNKKIEKIDIEDNLVFKGNAVGVASEGDGYSNAIFLDGTLTFNFNKDNMEEKLDFSFDNFYDFSVSKKDNNITFSNIKANNISERFDGIDEILSNSNNLNPVLSINYYGDNNKPIEMVGGLNIDKSDDRKFNMDISFGAKINK